MSWILIAVIGYFFLGLVNIGDKIFLGNFIPNYKAYTFLISVLGLIIWVVSPWYLRWNGFYIFIISLLSGVLFTLALFSFFYSLQIGKVSRVVPLIGGMVPVFSFIFSLLFLDTVFKPFQIWAFLFLTLGSVVLVRLPYRTHFWHHIWDIVFHHKHSRKYLYIAIFSALFFALSFVSSKYVYGHSGFINGFIWIRLGSAFAGLFILLNKDNRKAVRKAIDKVLSKKGILFFGNQGFGAVGFFLQNLAISKGVVAIVNAMQGVQYVFVILLSALLSFKFPQMMKEGGDIDKKIIIEKIIASIFIAIGLWFLFK